MFQTQHAVPPPYYVPHHYRTPPMSPSPVGAAAYYSPRHFISTGTPSPKRHARRATQDASYYSTPRKASYTTQHLSSPIYVTSTQTTPQRKPDYVSDFDRIRGSQSRRFRVPADDGRRKQRTHSGSKHYSSRSQRIYDDEADYEYLPAYEQCQQRPPPYERHQSYYYRDARADHPYYDQVPIYTPAADAQATYRSRARRASYASKPTQPPPRPRPSAAKPPVKATEEDVRQAGIPAGYSYKNWDPTEEPILLLGSVFDANSLGKWIYDWTVFFYGPATPMSEVAGELWLLLIQLAGKVKRAEDCVPRIRQQALHDLVDDFLESGERLWQRFNKLLKLCEHYMWKAARRDSGDAKKVTMGQNSGCEFVDAIFGRDRELERTEKLMTGMRLWSMRFDANCDDILRNPSA